MKDIIINQIEKNRDKIIKSIVELVKIDSVKSEKTDSCPYGEGTKRALDKALEISSSMGFQVKNLENHIGYAKFGSGEEYICAIGHLDVVPPGEGWDEPPFSGYIKDEIIYGRGVLDNKGPTVAALYGMYALKELNIKPNKEIRVIFGLDEESGFEDLKYYLEKEKPPVAGFTPDCKYPVVYAERGRLSLKILFNKPNELFDFMNKYILNGDNYGNKLGVNFNDEEFGQLEMRGYTLIEEEDQYGLKVNFSYPGKVTAEQIIERIRDKAKNSIIDIQLDYKPVFFDKDCPMVKSMQEAYEYVTGFDGTPVTTTGGTYAKLMPNIVPFGPSFPGQKGIGHNPNEWMNIEDIITNAKIYALALYELSK